MAKKTDETGLRSLAITAGALLLWVVSLMTASRVLHAEPQSTLLRGAMVVFATGGFVAWLVAVSRLILTQDEFSQRIHLVAVALACAATAVLVMAGDFLQMAGFLGSVPLQWIWLAMGVLWWLGILAATRYYR